MACLGGVTGLCIVLKFSSGMCVLLHVCYFEIYVVWKVNLMKCTRAGCIPVKI